MVQYSQINGRKHYGTSSTSSATTTQAVRRAIQNSQESLRTLANRRYKSRPSQNGRNVLQ
jgi:hypothetical protein